MRNPVRRLKLFPLRPPCAKLGASPCAVDYMPHPIPFFAPHATEPASLDEEVAGFFRYAPDFLAVLDPQGRILRVSPSMERGLGQSAEVLRGRRFLRLVHPDDRSLAKERARGLLEGTPVRDLETRIRLPASGWTPVRWSVSAGAGPLYYAMGRSSTGAAQSRESLLDREIAELRLRTGNELHDGILQTLTAASLRIAAAQRLLRNDDAAAAGEFLATVAESLAAEQREIRLYVDEVKDEASARVHRHDLGQRLDATLERVGRIWGATISVDARVTAAVPPELGRQVLRISQEAAVNAIRHGGAGVVGVRVATDEATVAITITDDGRGFPFRGEYDSDALREQRLGPLSLKHRVDQAGGRITITSRAEGSKIEVRLPLPHPP